MQFPEGAFQKLGEVFLRDKRDNGPVKFDFVQTLICGLVISIFIWLIPNNNLERFEKIALDYFLRQRPTVSIHPDLVMIEIKEDSIQSIGGWPWPLDYHAQLIKLLSEWKVKSIVFDQVLTLSGLPDEGKELAKAVKDAGNVYLPVSLGQKTEKRIWVHSLPIVLEPEGEKKVWNGWPNFIAKQSLARGHINLHVDSDGAVRSVSPYVGYGGEVFPHLALRAAFDFLEKPLPSADQLALPLDRDGNFLIAWPGRWRNIYEHYNYADIIQSGRAMEQGMKPGISPAQLKGKICLIGVTASGLSSPVLSPYESLAPNMSVTAAIMNSLMTRQFIIPVPFKLHALCLIMIGFIASFLFIYYRGAVAFIGGILLASGWLTVSFISLWQSGVWLYVAHPILLVLALFAVLAAYDQIVTARERKRLFELATRDGLTGLFVIRHFREIMNQVVAESYRKKDKVSVILIDIDNFKKINDTYGHPAGDMVLRKTAQLIHSKLRSKRPIHEVDFVARYGGEEFIILLRNTALEDAAQNVGERVRAAVEKSVFRWHDVMIPVTVSVGVAGLRPSEAIPDPMVHRADEALYDAKHTGKNRVCIEHLL